MSSRDRLPGIICFEGSWKPRLDSLETVEPALRCLEAFGVTRITHRTVDTREELRYCVDKWLGASGRAMPAHGIGMFAFHGSRNTIYLGGGEVTLDELAEIIGGRGDGKILYLGGCGVLALPGDDLMEFCRSTGARGVVGYSRTVDFVETSAFEIVLLNNLVEATSFKPVYTRLRREHPEWTRVLGLRMAHRTWASERLVEP